MKFNFHSVDVRTNENFFSDFLEHLNVPDDGDDTLHCSKLTIQTQRQ